MPRHAPSRSLVFVWLAIMAACNGQADRPAAPTAPAPPPAAPTAPAALVFEPLAWDVPEHEAERRLQAAGMAPRSETTRGYFSTPPQLQAEPRPIIAHTVEPVLLFTPRPGWTGTAHFPTVGGALDTIELAASLSAAGARAELSALEQRLGPPNDRRTLPGSGSGSAGSLRLIWVRGGVWLVASAGDDGKVSISFRRDNRPASEIGP